MKIRIGIPTPRGAEVCEDTAKALQSLAVCPRGYEYEIMYAEGSNISGMRNNMISSSKEIYQHEFNFDYYLSLDIDTGFTIENIYQLVDAKKDIIGGAYPYKENPTESVAGLYKNGEIVQKVLWDNNGIHRVDWVGSGFLLISPDALRKLEYPWFRLEIIRKTVNGKVYQDICSDDIGLALNCERHKIPVYLDCDCKLKHISLL